MPDTAMTVPAATRAMTRRKGRGDDAVVAMLRVAAVLITIVLVLPVGIVAFASGTGLIALPYEMFELARSVPFLFPAHMVASALALLLVPAVMLTRRRPQLHRPLGRLLGVFVVIGGLTALPVAVLSHSTPWARAGFFAQGLVWLYLFAAAFVAIRAHDVARHARLMVAMVAVTTGAVWFRVITGTAIALRLPFEPVYAVSAWVAWLIPLALVLRNPRLVERLLAR